MEFIVIPATLLAEVPKNILEDLGLNPRFSIDRTECLLHLSHYHVLFPEISLHNFIEGDNEKYNYPVYESSSNVFTELINSTV